MLYLFSVTSVVLCSHSLYKRISSRSLSLDSGSQLFFPELSPCGPNGCVEKLWPPLIFSRSFSCSEPPAAKTWVIELHNVLIKPLSDWLRTAETGLSHEGEAALSHSETSTGRSGSFPPVDPSLTNLVRWTTNHRDCKVQRSHVCQAEWREMKTNVSKSDKYLQNCM